MSYKQPIDSIENMADKKKSKGGEKQVEKVEPLVLLIYLLKNCDVIVVNHFSHILRKEIRNFTFYHWFVTNIFNIIEYMEK